MKDALAVSESGSNEGPSSEGPSSIPRTIETAPPGKGEAVVDTRTLSTVPTCLQVAREQQNQQDQQDQSDDSSAPKHGYLLFTQLQSPRSMQYPCQPGSAAKSLNRPRPGIIGFPRL